MLRIIQDIYDLVLNPSKVIMDFEAAMIKALRTILPSSTIHGCLFLLLQNFYRKVCELGLSTDYKSSNEVSKAIRRVMALPFINPSELDTTFETVIYEAPDDDRLEVLYLLL